MATATLTFDLTNIDDRYDHLRAVRSTDLALAILQIVNNTRSSVENRIEHLGEDKVTPYDAVDLVYAHIINVLNDYGVDIDALVQ